MKKGGYAYIVANDRPTLYVGVTSDLVKRIFEHKNKTVKGFTEKYNIDKLVYYEMFNEIEQAIIREKQLKNMSRNEKLALISRSNPSWEDLYSSIIK